MCYALKEENILFSGDHIMGWSTSVVSPPDGHMGDYLNSLNVILEREFTTIWPTHGPAITDVKEFVQAYIEHRHIREAQILEAINAGHTIIIGMVKHIYTDIDKRLYPAAAHSVLAHIIYMCEKGIVKSDTVSANLKSRYHLCSKTKAHA